MRTAKTKEQENLPENDLDRMWISVWKMLKYHNQYESFDAAQYGKENKIYDLLGKDVATGLLQDMVATTTRLTQTQRIQKECSRELYDYYCILSCLNILKEEGTRWVKEDLLSEIFMGSSRKAAKKGQWEEDGLLSEIRKYVKETVKAGGKLYNFYDEIKRMTLARIPKVQGRLYRDTFIHGKKTESLQDKNSEDSSILNLEVLEKIVTKATDLVRKQEIVNQLAELVDKCRNEGWLTQDEVDILGYYYNLGSGYEFKNRTKIAETLQKSPAYITIHEKRALQILRKTIEQDCGMEKFFKCK